MIEPGPITTKIVSILPIVNCQKRNGPFKTEALGYCFDCQQHSSYVALHICNQCHAIYHLVLGLFIHLKFFEVFGFDF